MAFALLIVRGKGRGRGFHFEAAELSIGRDARNGVVVNEPAVSRLHARIARRSGRWMLLDQGSANGTELNGRKVARARLRDGDRIGVGAVLFEFQSPPRTAPARAAWSRLRPPARATLIAASVLLFGITVECAAHPEAAVAARSPAPTLPDTSAAALRKPAIAAPDDAGRLAYERGRRSLRERRIAPRNLYDAWRAFIEARLHLQAGSALPVSDAELLDLVEECERELERECRRLRFSADRFERYGEPERAQQVYREALLFFPGDDPGGCRRKAQDSLVSAQPAAASE